MRAGHVCATPGLAYRTDIGCSFVGCCGLCAQDRPHTTARKGKSNPGEGAPSPGAL